MRRLFKTRAQALLLLAIPVVAAIVIAIISISGTSSNSSNSGIATSGGSTFTSRSTSGSQASASSAGRTAFVECLKQHGITPPAGGGGGSAGASALHSASSSGGGSSSALKACAPSGGSGAQTSTTGGASNARSGPAAGGSAGTVSNRSSTGFTLKTPAGQKVTIDTTSSTSYKNSTGSTAVSGAPDGTNVLVLGTTDSTTIKASEVLIEPSGAASSSVVTFKRGTQSADKKVGTVPSDYTEGQGTIVSGKKADEAIVAALAKYPGGIVDRVVNIGNGVDEVHNIGVNWPHHIFVSSTNFKVTGAN